MTLRLALLAGLFVVGFGTVLLLGLLSPPRALLDEMRGAPYPADDVRDPLQFGHGLYAPETTPGGRTFRWSDGRATLTFPYAAYLGRYATVSVSLASGDRVGQPITTEIVLNGQPSAEFDVGGDFATFSTSLDTLSTPNPYLDPAHIQVDLVSATLTQPGDDRRLGVMIGEVRVVSARDIMDVLAEAAVAALALLAIGAVALRRFPLRWGIIYAALAFVSLAFLYARYYPRGISPGAELALVGMAWFFAVGLAPKKAPVWGLGLAACLLWLVLAGRALGEWQMDDAYISYRYALNLVEGYGLVYNPGEVVEGYTNFLWTMVAAASLWMGAQPVGVMLATTIAASLALVATTWHLSMKLSGGNPIWALLAAGALSIDSALISYGARGSGMEAAPFAALVLISAALLWRGEAGVGWRVAAGVTLALATLMRPEGLLVAAIFVVVRAVQERRNLAPLLWTLAPFVLIVGAFQIWRISFYGYLFPNTFYAKTGATSALIERGLSHFSYFIGDNWLLIPLAALGVVLALMGRERRGGMLVALALLVVAYSAYIVWAGGDHFPGWRFFVPILAPIVLLAQEAVRLMLAYLPMRSVAWWGATVVALFAGSVYALHMIGLERADGWLRERTGLHTAYVNRWGSAGLWLRDNTRPDQATAAKGAGAIAYYSRRPVIDVYGLNDLHIGHLEVATMGTGNPGHDKQDPEYVLALRPDYVLAEWLNYFDPVRAEMQTLYEPLPAQTPTGPEIVWWHRIGILSFEF